MPVATTIKVEGLKDFQRDLRAADASFPKELRLANLAAAQIVAAGTKQKFASLGGSAPKAVATVKAQAQQRSASVKIGGGRSVGGQVALGNEFGGRARPTTQQFPPFRKGGYALYPTIAATREEVVAFYGVAVDRLSRKAFPR